MVINTLPLVEIHVYIKVKMYPRRHEVWWFSFRFLAIFLESKLENITAEKFLEILLFWYTKRNLILL